MQNSRTCPSRDPPSLRFGAASLGGYEIFEGIRGWIPHEQIEGQSTCTN